MTWNAAHHHGVIDPQVIVAALGAAAFLYARFKVTPVADPRDGNGNPLKALPLAPAQSVITVNTTGTSPREIARQVSEVMRRGGYMAAGTAVSDLPPPPASMTVQEAGAGTEPPAPAQPPAAT